MSPTIGILQSETMDAESQEVVVYEQSSIDSHDTVNQLYVALSYGLSTNAFGTEAIGTQPVQPPPQRLLNIPLEVRRMIWNLLVGPEVLEVIASLTKCNCCVHPDSCLIRLRPVEQNQFSILNVCHQTRNEYLEMIGNVRDLPCGDRLISMPARYLPSVNRSFSIPFNPDTTTLFVCNLSDVLTHIKTSCYNRYPRRPLDNLCAKAWTGNNVRSVVFLANDIYRKIPRHAVFSEGIWEAFLEKFFQNAKEAVVWIPEGDVNDTNVTNHLDYPWSNRQRKIMILLFKNKIRLAMQKRDPGRFKQGNWPEFWIRQASRVNMAVGQVR